MNKRDVLKLILSALGSFTYHPFLVSELHKLLAHSGFELQFFKILTKQLRMLSSLGVNAVNLNEFEPLGNGLYSLHCAGKGFNIRILYSFLSNRKPILLLAFYEREGKSNTDYSPYLEPARNRLNEKKEEFLNGKI